MRSLSVERKIAFRLATREVAPLAKNDLVMS